MYTPASQEGSSSALMDTVATEVVRALTLGDLGSAHRGFRRLHDHFFWRVNRFIRGRLRAAPDPESEADDLSSEAFLQLWRQLGSYDPARGSIGGLLFVIARRLADHRSARNLRAILTERVGGPSPSQGRPVEDMPAEAGADSEQTLADGIDCAWQEDNRARLIREVQATAPDAFQLLQLRYQEGHSFKEVAQRMGLTPDNARQRDIAARLLLFRLGWRLVREEAQRAGRSVKAHRAQTMGELATLLHDDPAAAALFEEHFGAASWRLVSPRRERHGQTQPADPGR